MKYLSFIHVINGYGIYSRTCPHALHPCVNKRAPPLQAIAIVTQSDSDTPKDSLPLCEHVNANGQCPARSTLISFLYSHPSINNTQTIWSEITHQKQSSSASVGEKLTTCRIRCRCLQLVRALSHWRTQWPWSAHSSTQRTQWIWWSPRRWWASRKVHSQSPMSTAISCSRSKAPCSAFTTAAFWSTAPTLRSSLFDKRYPPVFVLHGLATRVRTDIVIVNRSN